jgi:hypothetical protein
MRFRAVDEAEQKARKQAITKVFFGTLKRRLGKQGDEPKG